MSRSTHRKDLRKDEIGLAVAHKAGQAFTLAKAHRQALVAGIAALVVIGLAASGWLYARQRSERAARAALAEVTTKIEKLEGGDTATTTGDKPTWEGVSAELRAIGAAHPNTVAGRAATFQACVADLRQGKAGAAEELDKWLADNRTDWLAPQALAALATAREDAGDVAGAEKALKELHDGTWRSWPPESADVLLAELYERHDRRADAKTIWERLSKDEQLAKSPVSSIAKSKLADLGS
jgi:hypothetical protein